MSEKKCITKITGTVDSPVIDLRNHNVESYDGNIGECIKCGLKVDKGFVKSVLKHGIAIGNVFKKNLPN